MDDNDSGDIWEITKCPQRAKYKITPFLQEFSVGHGF